MSELRLNVVTKEWVIISPERAVRPRDFRNLRERPALPSHDAACPFCPGNETNTTAELFRLPGAGGPWATRVVSNKFAALSPTGHEARPRHAGLKHAVDGYGVHEVVIETPRHDLTTAMLDLPQVEAILKTQRARYQAAARDPRIAHVLIFKNHGPAAGTSLIHPHSQVVATPVVSYQVRDRIRTLEDHFALYGECVLCRMIAEEIEDRARIIACSDSFVAMVPYAALSSFHIWIFPRRHMSHFGEISDEELPVLASILRKVLRQLYFGLGDPDFNYVIRSAPRTCGPEEFHWYISIVPRTGRAAGFELGSGMFINDAYPEASAEYLRSVDTHE